MKTLGRISLIAALVVIVAAVMTVAYLQWQPNAVVDGSGLPVTTGQSSNTQQPSGNTQQVQLRQSTLTANEELIVEIYERVSPAVVNITSNMTSQFGAFDEFEIPYGTGSGFIIDDQGHILTNNHVVEDANSLDVTFADGTTVVGTVVGRDPFSDLAIVKVDLPAEKLANGSIAIATLGDSSKVRVGQMAIAIGNPFGLERTITVGVVSGLGREIPANNQRYIRGGIQTDAAINPGNSGGPLLDSSGNVIGINTAIESPVRGSVGIGLAVPVNLAKKYMSTLMAGGEVQHPWLGIRGQTVTERIANELDLDVQRGVYVVAVETNGPAARAGLRGAVDPSRAGGMSLQRGGDVILAVDGVEVNTVGQIAEYLELNKNVGDQVTLTVQRGSETIELPVTLDAWPDV